MNAQTPGTPRSRAAIAFHLVLLAWLIGLSAVALIQWKMTPRLAQQDQLVSVQQQQQRLAEHLATLDESIQALRAQPPAATAATLQETREALEVRLVSVEKAVSAQVTATDFAALRTEIEQLKVRQTARNAPVVTKSRKARPAATEPKEAPLPFRVIGAELRAGERSVSVAPLDTSSADQIQPVLVGEPVGAWRLEAIDGQMAVFRAGEQTRRVAIP
jgi:DNA primase